MNFDLKKSIEILSQTPVVLDTMLGNLSDEWVHNNEGDKTWSPYDVVGHLIHGERTDWIPRMEIILSDSKDKTFKPFDRLAQFEESKGKSMKQLLDEFKTLRAHSIQSLQAKQITSESLSIKGLHPALGEVNLQQLLATWTVHDLGHIMQIARVMAKQYTHHVGPWKEYLTVLSK